MPIDHFEILNTGPVCTIQVLTALNWSASTAVGQLPQASTGGPKAAGGPVAQITP